MQRDSYFDNYRGMLAVLVVVAHFIGPFRNDSHTMKFIETSIYLFHMPAFAFICAYFSKQNDLLKLVKRIFVPYVGLQIVYHIVLNYVWGRPTDFRLLLPKYSLWFLLSLFCWRVLIDKIILVKGIVPISFLLGILVGFDTSIGEFAAIGRTVAFLPFFILGYKFDKSKFMEFGKRYSVKICSLISLLLLFGVVYLEAEHINFSILSMKNSYEKIGEAQYGWLYRLIAYLCATLIIYLIAIIIPRGKHWYTKLGQRTMSIYLLHGLIYKSIEYLTDVYTNIDTRLEMGLTIVFSVSLTLFLSLRPFHYIVRKLSDVPVEKMLITNGNEQQTD
ncbi:fucose 4-O-acetylase-like acetyltransferase [Mobilisporobacter senegalensis]|uniref:Fucose 4-O-acetylase-like acetyltransferase n=1 Tax=Mobilisporobacter senegalensis TaxID=1329262 RepID=A0A3N1XL68_9FIRM|nr:acyltransferase family protein [Mobilisporobacter senegalensis]ROR27455.1 fucose 4-O-acetylase-like acetyltransferase [Mobilisporobacter senegalensis]